MTKLTIRIERSLELLDSFVGIPKILYRIKQKVVYSTLISLLKKLKYERELRPNLIELYEEGTDEFIDKEKIDLEDFMFADYNKLKDDPKFLAIKRHVNDRGIKKATRLIKLFPSKIKNKFKNLSAKNVLGQMNVLSWLARLGIFVTWKIE